MNRWLQKGENLVPVDEKSGRPSTLTTENNVKVAEGMVMENRGITLGDIANASKVSNGSAYSILHDRQN
jgi:hypothetical protein